MEQENDVENLKKAIMGWLRTKGYPLEMNVAKVFRLLGFGLRQGWYFNDPEENKPREIDLLAHLESNSGHPIMLQVVTECKRSEYPFLVFQYPFQNLNKPNPEIHPANSAGLALLKKLVELNEIEKLPIFAPTKVWGYDIKQVRVKFAKNEPQTFDSMGKDDAFEALMKVSKATFSVKEYFQTKRPRVKKSPDDPASYVVAALAFPLVVTDGPLFECHITESEEIEINPIENALINWNYPLLGNLPIWVYTKGSLPKFAETIFQTNQILDSMAMKIF
jgi:hypothetical protein